MGNTATFIALFSIVISIFGSYMVLRIATEKRITKLESSSDMIDRAISKNTTRIDTLEKGVSALENEGTHTASSFEKLNKGQQNIIEKLDTLLQGQSADREKLKKFDEELKEIGEKLSELSENYHVQNMQSAVLKEQVEQLQKRA